MLIDRRQSCLCLVDVQQRLVPAMAGADGLIAHCTTLLRAAGMLEVPVLVSEQYPRGLGPTVESLMAEAGPAAPVAKQAFSCARDAGWRERFNATGRRQAVLCGIEAHVCVLQTALDLAADGVAVTVVGDAVASRVPASRDAALARLMAAGVTVATVEMVLFEWLGDAGHPAFRDISALIR
jgi:nicotinamidase-related amidase